MIDAAKPRTLKQEWEQRDGKRTSVLNRAEEYAEWTIPSAFPKKEQKESSELQLAKDSIGAKGVNHLSNRVVDVLFPAPPRTFFRLEVEDKLKEMAEGVLAAANGGDVKAAEAELSKASTDLETKLAAKEREAIKHMDTILYRPNAINLAQLLIITGNALIFHPPSKKPVQVYTLRDYIVVRDLSGEIILIMLKESKAFETFAPAVQDALRQAPAGSGGPKKYEDDTEITIYTKIELDGDLGKYVVTQAAEEVDLKLTDATFAKDKLPWIPLTWKLIRGENYGRGLVEEYSGAFHAINILTGSLLNISGVMGDIKFFVDPISNIDVDFLNKSLPGSYHSGRAEDVSALSLEKLNDAQFIATMVERYEKIISQAFLLNSQAVRNAERVTAEEIRAMAQELETSHGGIYSRLASQWQRPTAFLLLDDIGFNGEDFGIVPRIITGMESLSRLGEIDAIRLFLMDLQLLNTIPEDVRAEMHLGRFITVLGTNRQIEYTKFLKTPAEKQAEQQQQMQLMQMQMQQEANAKTQTAVASAAAKE